MTELTGDSSVASNTHYFFFQSPGDSICHGTPKKTESHSTGTYICIYVHTRMQRRYIYPNMYNYKYVHIFSTFKLVYNLVKIRT